MDRFETCQFPKNNRGSKIKILQFDLLNFLKLTIEFAGLLEIMQKINKVNIGSTLQSSVIGDNKYWDDSLVFLKDDEDQLDFLFLGSNDFMKVIFTWSNKIRQKVLMKIDGKVISNKRDNDAEN